MNYSTTDYTVGVRIAQIFNTKSIEQYTVKGYSHDTILPLENDLQNYYPYETYLNLTQSIKK